jgi:hypothetical protein
LPSFTKPNGLALQAEATQPMSTPLKPSIPDSQRCSQPVELPSFDRSSSSVALSAFLFGIDAAWP